MCVFGIFQAGSVRAKSALFSPLTVALFVVADGLYIWSYLLKELPRGFVFEGDSDGTVGLGRRLRIGRVSRMDFILCVERTPLVQLMSIFFVLASGGQLADGKKSE